MITITLAVTVVLFSLVLIWYIPKLQLRRFRDEGVSELELIVIEDKLRKTYAQILGGLLLLGGLYFDYRNESSNTQNKVSQEYNEAVKQLSDNSIKTKITAINTLKRLSSQREYRQEIDEVLFEYVSNYGPDSVWRTGQDVEEIMGYFGRGSNVADKVRFSNIRFKNINLSVCDFSDKAFNNCKFDTCQMQSTKFRGSDLAFSAFNKCYIRNASFSASDLQAASFTRSPMDSVDFSDALLLSAFFDDCQIVRSDFKNASCGITVAIKDPYSAQERKKVGRIFPKTTFRFCDLSNTNIASGTKQTDFIDCTR